MFVSVSFNSMMYTAPHRLTSSCHSMKLTLITFVFYTGLLMLAAGFLYSEGRIYASFSLHLDLIQTVLRSPLAFFDTTPPGRILNRFSHDLDSVDVVIPRRLPPFIVTFLWCIGTVAVIGYTTPLTIVSSLPIAVLYFIAQVFATAPSLIEKHVIENHHIW